MMEGRLSMEESPLDIAAECIGPFREGLIGILKQGLDRTPVIEQEYDGPTISM
jgi:hypothetical protein